jgi:hypothetical protein
VVPTQAAKHLGRDDRDDERGHQDESAGVRGSRAAGPQALAHDTKARRIDVGVHPLVMLAQPCRDDHRRFGALERRGRGSGPRLRYSCAPPSALTRYVLCAQLTRYIVLADALRLRRADEFLEPSASQ